MSYICAICACVGTAILGGCCGQSTSVAPEQSILEFRTVNVYLYTWESAKTKPIASDPGIEVTARSVESGYPGYVIVGTGTVEYGDKCINISDICIYVAGETIPRSPTGVRNAVLTRDGHVFLDAFFPFESGPFTSGKP